MAKGDKTGHEKGKVPGGKGGKDTDPTKDKATVHVRNYNITDPHSGKKKCACGEYQ